MPSAGSGRRLKADDKQLRDFYATADIIAVYMTIYLNKYIWRSRRMALFSINPLLKLI